MATAQSGGSFQNNQQYLESDTQTSEAAAQLYNLYVAQQLCDVTLISHPSGRHDETEELVSVECHKVVLSASSSYFRKMFCESVYTEEPCDDNISGDVNIVDVSPLSSDNIRSLLSFIYTGRCPIDHSSVGALCDASKKWCLENLFSLCKTYMLSANDLSNAIDHLEIAHQLSDLELIEHLLEIIKDNFASIVSSDQFKMLKLKHIEHILRSSDIFVESEDVIFHAVTDWLEAHPGTSDAERNALCSLIRYDELSIDCLCDVALVHPLMQSQPQAERLKAAVKTRCQSGTIGSSRKKGKQLHTGLYFVAKNKAVFLKTDKKQSMFRRDKVTQDQGPVWMDEYSAVAKTKDCLYVLGNFQYQLKKENLLYITGHGKSQQFTFLYDIKATTLTFFDGHLYAVGGRIRSDTTTNAVHRATYDGVTCTWQRVATMRLALCNTVAQEYEGMIYVIGGTPDYDSSHATSHVQRYNPATSVVERLAPLPFCVTSDNCGALVYNNQLVVFTTTQLMIYHAATDSWNVIKYDSVGVKIRPVVYYDHILGCVSVGGKCVLKSYDFSTNVWSDCEIDVTECWMPKFFGMFEM